MSNPSIPFVDLEAQYASIRDEVHAAIDAVLASSRFVGGPEVAAFEQEFAAYCGAGQAVGVANGTDALVLALRALEIGPGDEVITAANTFIATAAAIEMVGARPVLVDIDPRTHTLDPALLPAAYTARTRAVIPVHLYGQPADMDPIVAFAREHGLAIVEDAAQAHGATYQGRPVGSFGDVACFSFYPAKNLGAYGDGGALVTSNPALAERVRLIADHGRTTKYEHARVGTNSRLDALQAAVLRVKLRHLPEWNRMRQQVAAWYGEELAGSGVEAPAVRPGSTHVYHLYVIAAAERDALQASLDAAGIGTGIHYPLPLHRQPALTHLGYRPNAFPHSARAAAQALSLPMFPEMTREQVRTVASAIRREVSRARLGAALAAASK